MTTPSSTRLWCVLGLFLILLSLLGGYIMGHGTPDWWGSEPTETIFQTQDAGELAVRLGSVNRYDRRGNVLLIDSFEDGLIHVDPAAGGAPITATLSSARSRTGSYSAKIAAGVGPENWGEIYKVVPYSGLSKFGYEVSFTAHAHIDHLSFALFRYLDDTGHAGYIRWSRPEQILQYEDSAGDWQQFATGVDLSPDNRLFHTAKLVIDSVNNKYVRFMIDDESTDLSAYALVPLSLTCQPAIGSYIRVVPIADGSPTIYIDDMIITQNEP